MRYKILAISRFVKQLRKDGDCIVWTGGRFNTNYGAFSFMGQNRRAHKWIWEYCTRKQVPAGKVLHHRCGNTLCCNTEHLEVITSRENTIVLSGLSTAAKNSRKTHCKCGREFSGKNNRGERICHYCLSAASRKHYRNKK